jgi:hypothetical protein
MVKGYPKGPRARAKIHKVMSEFKHGQLRSGRGKAALTGGRPQAVAIALQEARRAGKGGRRNKRK